MPTSYHEIVERLEKASGPSFALDCEIAESLLPTEWFGSKVESWFGHGTGVYGCNTADGMRHLDCQRAPNFTASIDAARTLVPEGCGAEIGFPSPGGNGRPWAEIWWGDDPDEPRQIHVNADTLAIAVCLAALRARAAQGERG